MQPSAPYLQSGAGQNPSAITRSLDAEDLINIVRTNKSWLAGPALAGLVIAVVVAFVWPDTFVSSAVVRVVPPQVPEKLVPSNVNTAMTYRISAMAQTIQSRATLSSIIETYGLYPKERGTEPMEDIIEEMRDGISIGEVKSLPGKKDTRRGGDMSAFQVSFQYENRYLAQKVAQDLASRFINENTRQRAYQSAMTTQFLKEQWLGAKAEMDKLEQKLTEFRSRNAGRLPEQWNTSMQQANAMENRVNTLNSNISRIDQEKMVLQAEMRNMRDRIDTIVNAKPDAIRAYVDPRLSAFDERIRQSETELLNLLQRYKENHPDVVRYKGQIEVLRKERESYLKSRTQPADAPQQVQLSPDQVKEVRDLNARIATMQIQLQAKEMQIAQNMKDIDAANARIKQVHEQLMSAPSNDQEYNSLMRDYEIAKARYREFNIKMGQSELATDLETRQQGETLEMLDQASLPDTPSAPKRPKIILMGFAAGLAIGGTLVFGKELKDKTLKTLKDVRSYTRLTILGSVPLLENDQLIVRRRRLGWLAWSGACLVSSIIMGGAVYFYYANKV